MKKNAAGHARNVKGIINLVESKYKGSPYDPNSLAHIFVSLVRFLQATNQLA